MLLSLELMCLRSDGSDQVLVSLHKVLQSLVGILFGIHNVVLLDRDKYPKLELISNCLKS
jgi:hypothetical protein